MSRHRRKQSNDPFILWGILISIGFIALVFAAAGFFFLRWIIQAPGQREVVQATPNTPAPEPPPVWQPQPPPNFQFPPAKFPPQLAIVDQWERPDPQLRSPFVVDPKLENADGSVYLSDLQEFGVTEGPMGWKFAKNGQLGNSYAPQNRIIVNGKNPPKGLSTHPPFSGMLRVAYALGDKCKSVHGTVALSEDEDRFGFGGPVRFLIMGDGAVLWSSEPIGRDRNQQKFDVNVGGIKVLELRVYAPTGGVTGAHAVWVDPYVARK